jgi:formiminotetrahydrofolate cyclodeaminase
MPEMPFGRPSFAAQTLSEFSRALASADPVPGGGSASAVAASLAASLVAMVARLSLGRPRYADHGALHERAVEAAEAARARFLQLADRDAEAYAAFAAARRLPRETPGEREDRDARLRATALEAATIPLATVRECAALLVLVDEMAGRSNVNAASDLGVAAHLARAAAEGAAANVRVNLPELGDTTTPSRMSAELDEAMGDVERLASRALEALRSGLPREAAPAAR